MAWMAAPSGRARNCPFSLVSPIPLLSAISWQCRPQALEPLLTWRGVPDIEATPSHSTFPRPALHDKGNCGENRNLNIRRVGHRVGVGIVASGGSTVSIPLPDSNQHGPWRHSQPRIPDGFGQSGSRHTRLSHHDHAGVHGRGNARQRQRIGSRIWGGTRRRHGTRLRPRHSPHLWARITPGAYGDFSRQHPAAADMGPVRHAGQ